MADVDDQEGIHSIHIYPARMVPQVTRDLIKLYGREGEPIGDLHGGSGTVAVEGLKLGYDVISTDINPLAELLTRVKCTYIATPRLEDTLSKIQEAFGVSKVSQTEVQDAKDKIPHLDYWFKPNVIKGLIKLKTKVFDINDIDTRNFFKVCFSYTVRKASNIRTREFKLYRRPVKALETYKPNVLNIFTAVATKGIFGMNYIKDIAKRPTILTDDARHTTIKSNSLGLQLTSPPYGDSTTTVAYGQFSKYPLLWLGYDLEDVKKIDKVSLGGRDSGEGEAKDVLEGSPSLKSVEEKVRAKDSKRSEVLTRFFRDMNDSLKEMRRVLKDGRFCIIIIGNRTMRGVGIPTINITKELAEAGWEIEGKHMKFECLDVKERHIYQKRLPYVGAPQGRTGEWEPCDLIMNEAIIVLKSD